MHPVGGRVWAASENRIVGEQKCECDLCTRRGWQRPEPGATPWRGRWPPSHGCQEPRRGCGHERHDGTSAFGTKEGSGGGPQLPTLGFGGRSRAAAPTVRTPRLDLAGIHQPAPQARGHLCWTPRVPSHPDDHVLELPTARGGRREKVPSSPLPRNLYGGPQGPWGWGAPTWS